ncbi:MAG: Gfo/Idh/MocA family oxidoreductase [Longimicrobiales bacterium]|nr:Gfo/Idh/MocA family oxidoreductase [Longimicrobiales bacterium]
MMLRYGMVGGGPGAFIGGVHRMAAALDGEWRLVAGAFSADPAKSRTTGEELGLDADRVYGSYEEMAAREAALPEDERIEAVSIVTPNHLHFPVARAFLEGGFHVVCDKPLTTTLEDAETLCRIAAERDAVVCVTHNYTGYPMVKEARERVRGGALGVVRKVVVEYSQGWLATLLEKTGQKQAAWRTDPARAGLSSAIGDIGSHAHHLAHYVTGLEVEELFADLGTVVEGRALEDDATVLLRYEGGVRGLLFASQISTGERNHLRLRVYGSEGGLDWCQERPDRLRLTSPDGDETIVHDGAPDLSERARAHQRLPGGHPEGFIEAFANLYRNVARMLNARAGRRDAGPFDDDFPTVEAGARGVHFILKTVESGKSGRWVDARYAPLRRSAPPERTIS